jgi:RNA ligase (TIGR02306 family)
MERALASIQRVKALEPIEGADFIEKATILGWQVCMRKGGKVGDLVVYFEIDSILPDLPEFEFLKDRKFRVKTMRLKKTLSQGVALPVAEVSGLQGIEVVEGQDVTEILGVTKFELPVPTCLSGEVKGNRPGFVKKTDEFRVQSYPKLIDEMWNEKVYITTKLDGSSISIYYNPNIDEPFGVCSRNMNMSEEGGSSYWMVAKKYDLQNKLPEFVKDASKGYENGIVIQGELCGGGIQKNRLELKDIDMFIFNVYNLNGGIYGGWHELVTNCNQLGLKTVPLDEITTFDFTMDQLLEKAKGKYAGTKNNREGIVIRPLIARLSPLLDYSLCSMKVANNDYLLKDEE